MDMFPSREWRTKGAPGGQAAHEVDRRPGSEPACEGLHLWAVGCDDAVPDALVRVRHPSPLLRSVYSSLLRDIEPQFLAVIHGPCDSIDGEPQLACLPRGDVSELELVHVNQELHLQEERHALDRHQAHALAKGK